MALSGHPGACLAACQDGPITRWEAAEHQSGDLCLAPLTMLLLARAAAAAAALQRRNARTKAIQYVALGLQLLDLAAGVYTVRGLGWE